MIKKFLPLAPVVLTGLLLVQPFNVVAQTASQVTNAQECKQGIADTNEAKMSNPELGPKAAKAYEEIMELAEKRCEQKEFPFAAELLNVARGMVASE